MVPGPHSGHHAHTSAPEPHLRSSWEEKLAPSWVKEQGASAPSSLSVRPPLKGPDRREPPSSPSLAGPRPHFLSPGGLCQPIKSRCPKRTQCLPTAKYSGFYTTFLFTCRLVSYVLQIQLCVIFSVLFNFVFLFFNQQGFQVACPTT